MAQSEHGAVPNEKLIPFLSGLYNATAITIKNGKPALPAELVYQQLKTLRRQQKVSEAHRLCEASVEENRNGWGGLQDYSKTASSMRREEMLLRSAFADVSDSKKEKSWNNTKITRTFEDTVASYSGQHLYQVLH